MKDLEKAKQSGKRSLEKDNELQLNIFGKLKPRKKLEILRIEIRLNKRQKIKRLLNQLAIKSDLTFKSLFKISTSKEILLHYLDELESKRAALLDYRASSDKALLAQILFNNPKLKLKQILSFFSFKKALETMTLREFRILFANSIMAEVGIDYCLK